MRLTIASKLSFVSALFIAATALSIISAFYFGSSDSLLQSSLRQYSTLSHQAGQRLTTLLQEREDDMRVIARLHSVSTYVELLDNSSADSAWTQLQLEQEVAREFASLLELSRDYYQLRFFDLSGSTRIRVERRGDEIAILEGEQLRENFHTDFVLEALKLPVDSSYFSPIHFRSEDDKATEPSLPILHIATPMVDAHWRTVGLLVLDVDISLHLRNIRASLGAISQHTYITYADGSYLSRDIDTPDEKSARTQRIQNLLPETNTFYHDPQLEQLVMLPSDNRNNLAVALRKLHYDAANPGHFLVIGIAAPKDFILRNELQLLRHNIYWTLLLTIAGIFIAWLLSQRITRHLNTITKAALQFIIQRKTLTALPPGNDEISQLGRVIKKLTDEVLDNEQRLKTLNATLEQRIETRSRELSLSQKTLETVLDALPNRVFWKDTQGRYLWCNQHFADDAGIDSPQQIIGLSDHDLPWKIYAPEYRQNERRVVESGVGQLNKVEPAILADGTTRWLETHKLPLQNAEGETFGVLGSYLDITDRHNAESELRHSEERLRKSQQIAHVGTWDWEITEDTLHWSEGIYAIFGLNQQNFAVSYQAFLEHVHPGDIDRVTAAVDYSLRHPDAIYSIDHRIVRGDGEVRYVEEQGEVYRNRAGEPARMIGVVHDITDHTLAQLALHREKERTERYLQSTEAIIVELDRDGFITRINQRGCDLLGYQMGELLGRNWFDYLSRPTTHGDYKTAFCQLMQRCQGKEGTTPQDINHEEDLLRRDGKQVTISWHTTTNFDERGKACGTLCAGQDITQRKHIEQLKDEFISTVSHELRTPLTSIHGSLRLLLGHVFGEIPPKVLELLKVASSNSERLLALVNDLLDIQKIEAGMMQFKYAPVSPATLLQEAVDNNSPYAAQHDIELKLETAVKKVPAQLHGDHGRLLQVMNNLISNAIKFSPQGASVRIQLHGDAHQLQIEVNDRGPGIPEADRERLFDKFTQVDSSDARQQGGSGLGLNIARLIVEKHGGNLTYHDNPGGGSSFRITLPLQALQQAADPDCTGSPLSATLPAIEN